MNNQTKKQKTTNKHEKPNKETKTNKQNNQKQKTKHPSRALPGKVFLPSPGGN